MVSTLQTHGIDRGSRNLCTIVEPPISFYEEQKTAALVARTEIGGFSGHAVEVRVPPLCCRRSACQ